MSNGFAYPSIAAMGPWDFWAHPDNVVELVEDADKPFVNKPAGYAPPASRERIQRALMKAAFDLRDAEVGSPQNRKPS